MKKNNPAIRTAPEPELIQNARRIEMLKAREKSIKSRLSTILAEAAKLEDESSDNTKELAALVRRNDGLSSF